MYTNYSQVLGFVKIGGRVRVGFATGTGDGIIGCEREGGYHAEGVGAR